MEYNSLEVTIISAKDLKKVTLFSKMSVYAIATISGGDPSDIRRTTPDRKGGRSPTWGTTVRFVLRSADPRLALHVLLRSSRIFKDTEVGEVFVPLKDLLEAAADGEEKFVSYQVRRPSGKPKGVLNLSYKVIKASNGTATASTSEITAIDKGNNQPVTAYPIASYPAPGAPYNVETPYGAPAGFPSYPGPYPYPMAGPGYGYGAAPPPGYGYVAQAPQKSNFGAGLGMGILGGALGGMVLGDLIADSAYDVGYDAGFDGGIDF